MTFNSGDDTNVERTNVGSVEAVRLFKLKSTKMLCAPYHELKISPGRFGTIFSACILEARSSLIKLMNANAVYLFLLDTD